MLLLFNKAGTFCAHIRVHHVVKSNVKMSSSLGYLAWKMPGQKHYISEKKLPETNVGKRKKTPKATCSILELTSNGFDLNSSHSQIYMAAFLWGFTGWKAQLILHDHAPCFVHDVRAIVRKYSSTSYVGIRWVQNGVLHLRYRTDSAITKAERCKAFTYKNLSLFYCRKCSRASVDLSQSWENRP